MSMIMAAYWALQMENAKAHEAELRRYQTWAVINGYSQKAIDDALAFARRHAETRVEHVDVIALARATLIRKP